MKSLIVNNKNRKLRRKTEFLIVNTYFILIKYINKTNKIKNLNNNRQNTKNKDMVQI